MNIVHELPTIMLNKSEWKNVTQNAGHPEWASSIDSLGIPFSCEKIILVLGSYPPWLVVRGETRKYIFDVSNCNMQNILHVNDKRKLFLMGFISKFGQIIWAPIPD